MIDVLLVLIIIFIMINVGQTPDYGLDPQILEQQQKENLVALQLCAQFVVQLVSHKEDETHAEDQ